MFHKALCWVHFFFLLKNNSFFGLKHHLYAADTQIYTSFFAEDITQSSIVVQNCMLAIHVWMNQNILELNPSKKEFMIIGDLSQCKKVLIFSQLDF